jgi:site-specific recombinase XerD
METEHTVYRIMDNVSAGPLSPFIKHYAASLSEHGYTPPRICYRLRLFSIFNRWLRRTGRGLSDVNEATCRQFCQCRVHLPRASVSPAYILQEILTVLRQVGAIIPVEDAPLTPAQQLRRDYEIFLVDERALSERTASTFAPVVDKFLSDTFGAGLIDLRGLRPSDVTEFVQRRVHEHGPSRAAILASATRSFLRYLHFKGLVDRDLSVAVPCVARWSCSNLPKYLAATQVRLILQHCDRGTPTGRRDYAILLLLARLGLRASEVAELNLEDIDWQTAAITIHGKGGRLAQLPLPADAGQAVARYLRRDRQPCACRRVFIRGRAPMGGICRTNIAAIVRRAIDKAGVDAPHKGAHVLRHSLATTMLRAGRSLDEIGELLRHKSRQSTLIYAKVDVEALRTLAPQWPEGLQ